jgi:hypothetical protein
MYCVNDMAFVFSTVLDVRHTYYFSKMLGVKITHTVRVQTVEVMHENVLVSSVVMNPKLLGPKKKCSAQRTVRK